MYHLELFVYAPNFINVGVWEGIYNHFKPETQSVEHLVEDFDQRYPGQLVVLKGNFLWVMDEGGKINYLQGVSEDSNELFDEIMKHFSIEAIEKALVNKEILVLENLLFNKWKEERGREQK